jgi:imidazolonepropionase-like amidohydrolase
MKSGTSAGIAVIGVLAGVMAGLALTGTALDAQEAGKAASPATRNFAIVGARIVTLAGPPIESGTVVVRDGTIAAVGDTVDVPSDAQQIDGKGLHVYPGFFDAVTQLGLTEFSSVGATVDVTETGAYNPQLVAATAVHPSSEHIPVARANGVTHAVAAPGISGGGGGFGGSGTTMGGQASAIHLDGWTVEEMLIRKSVGIVVNWPRLSTASFDVTTFSQRQRPFNEVKEEYDKRVTELGDWIERARRYQLATEKAADSTTRDLKLEALVPVVKGELPLLIVADLKREIRDAIAFCADRKLKLVLLRAREAAQVKDLLVKHQVPVILGPTQALPTSEDAPYDAPLTLPAELHKAGLKVSISTFNSSDSRTLPFEAGNAVAFGLPWEEALKAITVNPAEALGLGDRLGTLTAGKVANLIVTTGDPLEITTRVKHLFINGHPTTLDNRHERSYERWRSRPKASDTK